MSDSTSLPTGTVTFLFTDIEGSTRLWEHHPHAMEAALARHDALAAEIIPRHDGVLLKHRGEGDSLFAVFSRAADAVAAALTLQCALTAQPWPADVAPRTRLALHAGDATLRDGDYFGTAVNRCARLRAVAHGGQVLLSDAIQALVQDALPPAASLRDLGALRLRDLQRPERVFQLLHPDLPADFPPLVALDALPNNLPLQVTSFIGREKEMAEVQRLLKTARLLTLTGTGGTGKTRLAQQVAADLLQEYPDGVWLVELAPLADPSLVPQTAASAIGVREEPGRPVTQTLVEALKPKKLLLLLDNAEHLLAECATLADALLRGCPGVTILATSREGLNIAGEQTFRVPSLAMPDPRDLPSVEGLQTVEAVRLFAERAVLAQPSFAITLANAAAVAQVCQRLDGIPLAIELAAARVKALPVEKIAGRLDDRFRLLTGGSRTALPRQQTLRALIDWSYDLLSEAEQSLLRRLAVFAGGWTLEAAEVVCAGDGVEEWEVLDRLTSLVEKSLVLYEEQGGEGRYRLLETVRQYARDRLLEGGETATVRDRHRDWFLALAEQAEPGLQGESETAWLDRLEREHDNLRAALGWCQTDARDVSDGRASETPASERPGTGRPSHDALMRDADAGLRLGGALWLFWMARGYVGEGREHLAGLLALPGAQARTSARARALLVAAMLAHQQGDYATARSLSEECLAISRELGDKRGVADSLGRLGMVAREQGNYAAGRALLEESLTIYRGLQDKESIAHNLNCLGNVAHDQGSYGTARALSEESLAIYREVGSKLGSARSLISLGSVAHAQGDHGAARALFEQSLAIFREGGGKWGISASLKGLGIAAHQRGDYRAARALFEESLVTARELGHKPGIVAGLEGLAAVAVAQAQFERATRLFGTAAELREAMGAPLPAAGRALHDFSVAAVRTALGEEAFAAAWAEGRAMTLQEAMTYALEDPSTGEAE